MNYLSHHHLARRVRPESDAPSAFFAGNLLPDLVSVAGEGRLRTVGEAVGPLAEGARLHLATDTRFHGLPAFKAAQEAANALLLAARFAEPPRRRFFVAHVLVELALDADVLREAPDLPDDLYRCLAESLAGDLIADTEALLGRPAPGLAESIARFVASGFLRDYATPDGCATALVRVCRRGGLDNFAHADDQAELTAVFERFTPALRPFRAALLSLPDGVSNP